MPSILRGLGFPFDAPVFPAVLADDDVLEQSLITLAVIGPEERVMRPGAGALLERFLFEAATDVTASLIRAELAAVYARWEPRAEILGIYPRVVEEETDPKAKGPGWIVTVDYQSRITQQRGQVEIPVEALRD